MMIAAVPIIRLNNAELRAWNEVLEILARHGFTEIEEICSEGDLNRISNWLDTEQWKVFQKKCYKHINLPKLPTAVDETVYVNI